MEHYGPVYLAEMLFTEPRTTETETVTLSFPLPDQLDVVIAGAGRVPRRLSLSRKAGQFKCDGSTLLINTIPAKWDRGIAPTGVPVVGGTSVAMKVDLVEDYLILTRREKDFMWLPFPGWTTWSSWYRFRVVGAVGASAR